MNPKPHKLDCAWLLAQCEYRDTHHYCPHPEHACTCPTPRRVIVAEISKNWPEEAGGLLSERFEYVIAVNATRGYALVSWQLHRLQIQGGPADAINETVIAVFEAR